MECECNTDYCISKILGGCNISTWLDLLWKTLAMNPPDLDQFSVQLEAILNGYFLISFLGKI